jgi:hypothetical protein
MANRFPLIVDAVSETVRELAVADNMDLTGSGIYNNGATLTLPTATGTLATLAGTETFTNKTLTTPIIGTSVDSNDATFAAFATPTTITIGYASTSSSTTNISTGAVASGNTKTINIGTGGAAGSTTNINLGDNDGGTVTVNKDLVVTGDLTVNGTTTTLNSTTLSVDDKNIELGSTASPTDVSADGGGITLKGTTDKTFNWVDLTDAWTSSEHLNLLTGKAYYIAGNSVLNATTLGSGVVSSSLTSVGTIATGTWQGTVVDSTYGGTGVNNGGRTITLNTGNLTITAPAGGSSVTVPATGTLVGSSDTGTVTSAMIADGTIVNADINASAAIAVSKLAANTISGVTLGNNLPALTISTGLSGTSYNGSTAITIENTDKGSSQFIFKNIVVAGQTTIAAASNTESLTFVAGSGMSIQTDNSTKTLTFTAGAGGWLNKSANWSANVGESIIANTSGGSWTLTLPPSPSIGAQITVVDGADFQSNPLILGRNGNLINNAASNVALNYTGIKVDIIYNGTSWLVYGNTPSGADVLALGLALGDEF